MRTPTAATRDLRPPRRQQARIGAFPGYVDHSDLSHPRTPAIALGRAAKQIPQLPAGVTIPIGNKETSRIRIVTDDAGSVMTAYPIP